MLSPLLKASRNSNSLHIIFSVLNSTLIFVVPTFPNGFDHSPFIIRVRGRKQKRRECQLWLFLPPFTRNVVSSNPPCHLVAPLVITAQNLNMWPAPGFKEGSEITEHGCLGWLGPILICHKVGYMGRRNICHS